MHFIPPVYCLRHALEFLAMKMPERRHLLELSSDAAILCHTPPLILPSMTMTLRHADDGADDERCADAYLFTPPLARY